MRHGGSVIVHTKRTISSAWHVLQRVMGVAFGARMAWPCWRVRNAEPLRPRADIPIYDLAGR